MLLYLAFGNLIARHISLEDTLYIFLLPSNLLSTWLRASYIIITKGQRLQKAGSDPISCCWGISDKIIHVMEKIGGGRFWETAMSQT